MARITTNKMFLPAEKDRYGNIRMSGHPMAVNLFLTVLLLMGAVYLLNQFPFSMWTEFNGPVPIIVVFIVVGSVIAIIRIWRYRIMITDQHVKFLDLYGSQTIKYEDIKKVGLYTRSLYKNILIYDKIGRRYSVPFGGVGTNEIAELFNSKCGVQRCKELNDKMELMKKGH